MVFCVSIFLRVLICVGGVMRSFRLLWLFLICDFVRVLGGVFLLRFFRIS